MIKGTEKTNQQLAHGDVETELNNMRMHEVKTFPLLGGPWGHVEVTRVSTGWIYVFTSTNSQSETPLFVPSDRLLNVKIKGKW